MGRGFINGTQLVGIYDFDDDDDDDGDDFAKDILIKTSLLKRVFSGFLIKR